MISALVHRAISFLHSSSRDGFDSFDRRCQMLACGACSRCVSECLSVPSNALVASPAPSRLLEPDWSVSDCAAADQSTTSRVASSVPGRASHVGTSSRVCIPRAPALAVARPVPARSRLVSPHPHRRVRPAATQPTGLERAGGGTNRSGGDGRGRLLQMPLSLWRDAPADARRTQ